MKKLLLSQSCDFHDLFGRCLWKKNLWNKDTWSSILLSNNVSQWQQWLKYILLPSFCFGYILQKSNKIFFFNQRQKIILLQTIEFSYQKLNSMLAQNNWNSQNIIATVQRKSKLVYSYQHVNKRMFCYIRHKQIYVYYTCFPAY